MKPSKTLQPSLYANKAWVSIECAGKKKTKSLPSSPSSYNNRQDTGYIATPRHKFTEIPPPEYRQQRDQ